MSDQHNPHVMGTGGDENIRTPNLDALASRGVQFDNAYCGSPLCVPSRMTFLTGKHCSDIDVWSNGCILGSDELTFAHMLTAAGYETVLGGRMHFNGPDQRHGFETRIIGDVHARLDRIPMFTTGQSKECVEVAGPGRTAYSAYDEAVTRRCGEWLDARAAAGGDRPFCLVVGWVLPHCPYIAPKRLFDEYYDRIEIPRIPDGYLNQLHPAMKAWREHRGVDALTEEQVRVARAAYYGLVTFMDEQLGLLMETLEGTGLGQDAAVVYTSDHGDMAGEHGLWWKSSFYEGSVRVPLIFSWPGHFPDGRRVHHNVSLLDVGPTLLELAGAEALPDISGRGLMRWLSGKEEHFAERDEVFSEYCGLQGDPPARMIRSGPWKLHHYHGHDAPQLFNVVEDPNEVHDVAADPNFAGIRDKLHARVRDGWSGETIAGAMEKQARNLPLMREWHRRVRAPDSEWETEADRWTAPEGCNVFPEV